MVRFDEWPLKTIAFFDVFVRPFSRKAYEDSSIRFSTFEREKSLSLAVLRRTDDVEDLKVLAEHLFEEFPLAQ